jgi:prepilin signal peptidase PulO-like enzyme (type II secretory pathway)
MNDPWLAVRVFLVLAGPFVGDFVATQAVAWPRVPSLFGRSQCGRCDAPIAIGAKIPILSWLLNRGRRRCCGGRIPIAYPLGEVAGLICGIAAAAADRPAMQAWIFAVGMTLIYIALVDLRRFSIPSAGIASLGIEAALALILSSRAEERLATGAVLALALAALRRFSGRGKRAGLGGGDILLAGLLGVLVNWRLAAPMVALAAVAPLAVQLVRRKSGPVPFGFWLSIAAGLCLLAVELNLLAE